MIILNIFKLVLIKIYIRIKKFTYIYYIDIMEQKITKETKMEIKKSIEEFEKRILKFTKVRGIILRSFLRIDYNYI